MLNWLIIRYCFKFLLKLFKIVIFIREDFKFCMSDARLALFHVKCGIHQHIIEPIALNF